MADEDTIKASLDAYKMQLEQVNVAIDNGGNSPDLNELVQLQEDLKQLISLTEESLLSLQKSNLLAFIEGCPDDSDANISCSSTSKNNIENKMTDFYSTIESAGCSTELGNKVKDSESEQYIDAEKTPDEQDEEAVETSANDELNEDFLNSIESLSDISGIKCRAPYRTEWSGTQYHNAMINGQPYGGDDDDDIYVKVLFLYPTMPSMRPCPYFLEATCRFDEEHCRFSHGYMVSLYHLRPFIEADYSLLEDGGECLAKSSDEVWKPATILKIKEDHCYDVKIHGQTTTISIELKDILPPPDSCRENIKGIDAGDSESDDDMAVAEIQPSSVYQSDADNTPNSGVLPSLGLWEQHTKGIGSQLMQKMGYQLGQGLGKSKQGRLEPVPIILLPPRMSLDACMQLKLKKGVRSINDTNAKNAKPSRIKMVKNCRRKRPNCVFGFLNKTLGDKMAKKSITKDSASCPKDMFGAKEGKEQKNTRKMNKELFKNEEEMKKIKIKVKKLKVSIRRNEERNPLVAKSLRDKLKEMLLTLDGMKEYDSKMKMNQKRMETHRTMTMF